MYKRQVCNNGQTILDADGNILFQVSMQESAVLQTLEIAKQLNYAVVLKSKTRVISKEPDEDVYKRQIYKIVCCNNI